MIDVDKSNYEGKTVVNLAVEKGSTSLLELLLENNASVNIPDIYGLLPLHIAAKQGDRSLVNMLLNASLNT